MSENKDTNQLCSVTAQLICVFFLLIQIVRFSKRRFNLECRHETTNKIQINNKCAGMISTFFVPYIINVIAIMTFQVSTEAVYILLKQTGSPEDSRKKILSCQDYQHLNSGSSLFRQFDDAI